MFRTDKNWANNTDLDSRVKRLGQIEGWIKLMAKLSGVLIMTLVLALMFANLTKAQTSDNISDLYMVPVVKMTNMGFAVVQPQTGDGYNFTRASNNSTDILESGTSYRPPRYDAFAVGSQDVKVNLPPAKVSSTQEVTFSASNNMSGSSDGYTATSKSTFSFLAEVKSNSGLMGGSSGNYQYRWDFNNNGKEVTYFSYQPGISHQFKTAGIYKVKLEVLDKSGKIYAMVKPVTVVENDAPTAIFTADKTSAPVNSIVHFDTTMSSDNQYTKYNLSYRFDWDSDGIWDTNYQTKTSWNHQFQQTGSYTVTMQVMDPEGATAKAQLSINIESDNPPRAMLTVANNGGSGIYGTTFTFDGSQSSDDQTILGKLRFRWDFNYNGKDDINFDTGWSNSPKYTGNYKIGGNKSVRLQVMDEQGQVDETFAQIDVPWTEQYLKMAISSFSK